MQARAAQQPLGELLVASSLDNEPHQEVHAREAALQRRQPFFRQKGEAVHPDVHLHVPGALPQPARLGDEHGLAVCFFLCVCCWYGVGGGLSCGV